MSTMAKSRSFKDWQADQMKDPAFKEAVEELDPAFQVTCLRILREMTQSELAKRVGTKQSSIARLENGSTPPSLSFLRRIANALDATLLVQLIPNEELSQMNKLFAVSSTYSNSVTVGNVDDSSKSSDVHNDEEAVRL